MPISNKPQRPAPSRIAAMTVAEGVRALDAGSLTCEAWTQACYERIEQRNPTVKAWVYLDAENALAHARAVDRDGRKQRLEGVPIGIKDIMDTSDMPTECGDPEIFPGRRPTTDAAVVAMMRGLGLTILGKNTVSRHSIMLPGPARNPHNPAHTPGASSAGSAASVADFMTPISLGTQTGGSIVRPSTFCGVVGYKPTIDTLPYAGLRRYSRPLDTVGAIARSVEDITLLFRETSEDPRFDAGRGTRRDFTVGVWRPRELGQAESYVREIFEDNLRTLSRAGVKVKVLDVPAAFDKMADEHDVIMSYDLVRAFADITKNHLDKCDPELLKYLAIGKTYGDADYGRVLDMADKCRRMFYDVARDVDIIAMPATPGEAPDASDTGSNVFIRIWSLLHNPAITLPVARGPSGLPVGLQLVGFVNEDPGMLYWSRCVENIVGNRAQEI